MQLPGGHARPTAHPARAQAPPQKQPSSQQGAALPDQDSHGEMQERAESVQPDQNVNTAIA